MRETLFNWLAPHLPGARCLDLFAGSGVLGFEALSRGAEEVTFVERDPRLVNELRYQGSAIGVNCRFTVRKMDALSFLRGPSQAYDIVFADPPFKARLYEKTAQLLSEQGWLKSPAWIYIEADRREEWVPPESWHLLRSQIVGQVQGALFRFL